MFNTFTRFSELASNAAGKTLDCRLSRISWPREVRFSLALLMLLGVPAVGRGATFTTSPASGQQLTTTFSYTGTGLTKNGTIQQHFLGPGGSSSGTIQADSNGNVNWTYVYKCTDAPGTWYDWIVDPSGWTSPQVTNVVSANASCNQSYTVSVSPSTATVTQGGSASYTVTVQSQNGFSGMVGL